LFDNVVEILDLPQFTRLGKGSLLFQFFERFWIGGVFIDWNDARRHGVRRGERFGEKALGRVGIARRA
jgi:hypothetical protein